MTARRVASAPPRIAGHRFVRVLGLGGFADVFLYEQDMPRRSVAVKVLLAGSLDDDLRVRFQTEANLMAQLSHHPSIVTIFHADIAVDGRPYLVMEYCSGPALAERYRVERISVAEALRIGVRLGSAVETAHRAGILHRDIKPANVLTTDFGWPALTDFGIAATTGAGAGVAIGMSIPWSPPELLAERPTGDARSDVYSLAATVYSLLAGRTPFEVPGGANGAADLVARIERAPVPPTGRQDVPASLDAVLARAMSRSPAGRHPSAVAFARSLQQVEAELGFAVTPLDLTDEARVPAAGIGRDGGGAGEDEDGDDRTRLRPVVSIDPSGPRPAPTTRRSLRAGEDDGTRLRPVTSVSPDPAPAGTVAHRLRAAAGPQPSSASAPAPTSGPAAGRARADELGTETAAREILIPQPDPEPAGRGRLVAGLVSGGVVVAALVVVVALTLGDSGSRTVTQDPTGFAPPASGVAAAVPAPGDLTGVRRPDGAVVFTWTNPEPADGDRYLWGVRAATGEPELELVDEPTVTVPAAAATGSPVCVQVSIVRADRGASARPAEGCAP
ncbi:serine/threonine-protein kinase [Cellulomonas cellasea]|uniref:non-specific serine/threonine protein kinase n=1 Tax=Cellulomonas cellasea TaxID=43670 RepID=A0A7W4YA56_9CELL|nr:serine/threonine-protein kinase [Cellulomonas cellasea]MBB2921412.1 serine/threonine protein kinase [Cellulomonas cellasea]